MNPIYKKIIFVLTVLAAFTACSVDYEGWDSFINEPDYLVVNSLLSPSKPVKINFYQTMKADSSYAFAPLKGVQVLLRENDRILYDAVCEDSMLELPYYPKAGHSYSLEASIKEKTVKADTYIPVQATCKTYRNPGNWRERYMQFSSFQIDTQKQVSLWITAYNIYNTGKREQCGLIHTSHPLIDKFNWENGGPGPFNPHVGPHYHDAFLRIKNTHLPLFDNLIFEPYFPYYYPDSDAPFPVQSQIKLILASKEYDRYCKSLFRQKSMVVYEEDLMAIFYEPVQVYSNIAGGLGIFAGMNETDYVFDIRDNYDYE